MTKHLKKSKPKKGMALLLVMAVIVVVLTTISIGVTLLLNNIDAGRGKDDSNQAMAAAQAAIEEARGLYKTNPTFFNTCSVGNCIDFTNNNCTACTSATAIYSDGNRRYKALITAINPAGGSTIGGVTILATGYKGLFNRSVNAGISFYTPFQCGDTINDASNNSYATVKIGTQCWMAESLQTKKKQDGSCINAGCPDASPADHDLGRACYNDSEGECAKTGALYLWTTASASGSSAICPFDWHIPTDDEWYTLESFLYNSTKKTCDQYRFGSDCEDAGDELVKGGSSGFEADLGGLRKENGDDFDDIKNKGIFWTDTAHSASQAYARELNKGDSAVTRDKYKNGFSFSVRCLKD